MKQRMNNEVSRLVRVANQSGRLKRRQQAAEQEAERTLCGWLGISREELKQANIPEWRDALNGSEPLTAERATALLSRLRGLVENSSTEENDV